jgi:Siphovirus ReqiPepy6 Gp37-like protein
MDIFILDSLYRRNQVVDRFQSLIWTERFSSVGDFELQLHSTFDNRSRFTEGTKLAINESRRVMQVETVQDGIDDEGREILKVTGPSLETVLTNRLALAAVDDTTTHPKWTLTGTPKDIATQMFHDICVTGILDPGDVIPLINEGSLFPADTIAPPPDSITYDVDPKTLYEAEKDLCDLYLMGFRLIRNYDLGQLWFDIYTGSDRTSHQTTYPAVIFSPGLDNLKDTSELRSIATYKNTAYVISPVGSEIVYAQGVDTTVNGFERRVLLVNATDIDDPDPVAASAAMVRRGYEELSKNRQLSAFDGEISQKTNYVYGVDYNLGDLVEMRNSDGVSNNMQVTEQIIVSDENGDRSYPTLSLNQFIVPGSWAAQPAGKQWSDFTTEHWADMPG